MKMDKLVSFNSKTNQNKKEKLCNMKFKKNEKYLIDGSSYKGFAPHKFHHRNLVESLSIIKASHSQISAMFW